MREVVWIPLLVAIAAGCTTAPNPTSEAALIEYHEAFLQAVHEGDEAALQEIFSDTWYDFGGCQEKPSQDLIDSLIEYRHYSQEAFPSHRDLAHVEDAQVTPASEDPFATHCGHTYAPDDRAILFPPKEGSPFGDGWFGIYLAQENGWRLLGGD